MVLFLKSIKKENTSIPLKDPIAHKAYSAKYRKENAALIKEAVRASHLKRKFGISIEQYNTLLKAQDGRCAICKKLPEEFTKQNRRLAVDHDHTPLTGEVRGLVCYRCNRYVIGNYKRKDVSLIKTLLDYLDRDTYTGWIVPPKRKKKKRGKKKLRNMLQGA